VWSWQHQQRWSDGSHERPGDPFAVSVTALSGPSRSGFGSMYWSCVGLEWSKAGRSIASMQDLFKRINRIRDMHRVQHTQRLTSTCCWPSRRCMKRAASRGRAAYWPQLRHMLQRNGNDLRRRRLERWRGINAETQGIGARRDVGRGNCDHHCRRK
jgi:hypothetical protein